MNRVGAGLTLLLAEQAVCQGGQSRYVKRYQTEFAVTVALAIILLITTIIFLYKWIQTYRFDIFDLKYSSLLE
jgi:hypothetical protein